MSFYLTVLGIGGLDKKVEDLKKDALETVREQGHYARLRDIKLHRVVINPMGDKMEILEAYEEERLHKKKFSDNEELKTYLKEVQMEMSRPILDIEDRDIDYWGISPWQITEAAPYLEDEEDIFDLEENNENDYSDLDPELAELFREIDELEL